MDELFIKVFKVNGSKIEVSLETLTILFVYEHCKPSLRVNVVECLATDEEPCFSVEIENDFVILENLPVLATYCVLPIIIVESNTVISGLCSVARQIVKSTPADSVFRNLLGFREACLMACNESSIWTKFCEIDIIASVKAVLTKPESYFISNEIYIPKDLTRFEVHMSKPVRLHNVYKVAQDQAKANNKKISDINTSIPKEELELNHLFSEGPFMTLADIILFPNVHVLKMIFPEWIFKKHLTLIENWYENIKINMKIFKINIPLKLHTLKESDKVIQENIEQLSLYISDPKRYKPRNRIFTKQSDITNALNIIKNLNLQTKPNAELFASEIEFDWLNIPLEANPEGGALPKSRMKRKCEQLENLAKPIIKIAKPRNVIVDFCSGAGHLGILLACQLPTCKVILLENKEMSLVRAKCRVLKLKLDNVIFLQCNLDYFQADFDIGVSLHACGVATDLVIQHCLNKKAAFVSCPCCYGGVHNCHHLDYPRSCIFKNSSLTLRDYLVIGHSADQTHDSENAKTKQGFECMDVIDMDRKLQAEEEGYVVHLGKMIPETCTPKNNILVGWPKSKHIEI